MTKNEEQMVLTSVKQSFKDALDFGLRAKEEEIEEIRQHVLDNLQMVFNHVRANDEAPN